MLKNLKADNIYIVCGHMQMRPTALTIGLIIHFSITLFCVHTKLGIKFIFRIQNRQLMFLHNVIVRQKRLVRQQRRHN